jgi:ribonuclease P protein component
MGLPRDCRLTRKQQFDRVLSERTTQLRQGPFRVYAMANGQRCARLGLIVGKRQAKRAVDRNRIKRALRESFRNGRLALPSVDVVVQLMESVVPGELAVDAEGLWVVLSDAFEKENAGRKSA